MLFDRAALLAPISESAPCGPALNEHAWYDDFRNFSSSSERMVWSKHAGRALSLAQESRDLRAWVWLTRTSICTDGVIGLAAGLQLIADGLEKYWNILPPQHANENDPAERFMMRLSALTQIGATHFSCNLDDLRRFGRNFTDLQADLGEMTTKTQPSPATKAAADEAKEATNRICNIFARGFGPGRDPLVNFDTILGKLAAIESRFDASMAQEALPATTPVREPARLALVNSREDVVHSLDLVLNYYRDNEPSSPVPLLVARAKRLVSSSFIDAIKDLAPGGLKDLQTVAGIIDDRK